MESWGPFEHFIVWVTDALPTITIASWKALRTRSKGVGPMMWRLFSYKLLNLGEEVALKFERWNLMWTQAHFTYTSMFVLCRYIWKLQLSSYFWLFRYTMYTSSFSVAHASGKYNSFVSLVCSHTQRLTSGLDCSDALVFNHCPTWMYYDVNVLVSRRSLQSPLLTNFSGDEPWILVVVVHYESK